MPLVNSLKKINVLSNSIVFTSQGISFMLAGEEFLRTKQGNSNSYNASYEVNELDYSLKVKHADMVESYKKLIALKQDSELLHLNKDEISAVNSETTTRLMKSKVTYNDHELLVLAANGIYDLTEPEEIGEGYQVYWSTLEGEQKAISNGKITLQPYETVILMKTLVD